MSEQNSDKFQYEYEAGDKVWVDLVHGKGEARIIGGEYGKVLVVTHTDLLDGTVENYYNTLTPRGRKTKQRYSDAKAKWEEEHKAVVDDGRPKDGDMYWIIDSSGAVFQLICRNTSYDDKYWKFGNVYTTKQDAQNAADLMKLRVRYVRFIRAENQRLNWVADWSSGHQRKYFFYFDQQDNKTRIDWDFWLQRQPDCMYFGSEQTYQQIREAFTDDELRLVVSGVKVEGLV